MVDGSQLLEFMSANMAALNALNGRASKRSVSWEIAHQGNLVTWEATVQRYLNAAECEYLLQPEDLIQPTPSRIRRDDRSFYHALWESVSPVMADRVRYVRGTHLPRPSAL